MASAGERSCAAAPSNRGEASAADTVGVCESVLHSLDDVVDAGCVSMSMVDDEDRVVEAATWPAEEAAPVVDAAVGESLSMLCWGESMMENTMQLSARRVECVLVVYGDEGGGEAGGETGVRAHTSISLTSSSPCVAFARACSAACAERDEV